MSKICITFYVLVIHVLCILKRSYNSTCMFCIVCYFSHQNFVITSEYTFRYVYCTQFQKQTHTQEYLSTNFTHGDMHINTCEPHYHPGAIPYEDLPMNSLLARIVSGYRLPMPEHATDKL